MVSDPVMTGEVLAITPSGVSVRLSDGRILATQNSLNARCPPRSTVLVAELPDGRHAIIGRPR